MTKNKPVKTVASAGIYIIIVYLEVAKPRPIILNFLPIMLLSNAQKFANYAQYYAHA